MLRAFLTSEPQDWDYRHHDMHIKYNTMRVEKLSNLYNPGARELMGSGNRSTRIHEDAFFVTDTHIISGSHDYCNWIWSLDKPDAAQTGVYNAEHNDGGIIDEPFDVLDDYYWASKALPAATWVPGNERAGWWVKTPNQVLCFWHGAALANNRFAVCRPGRLFTWDIVAPNINDVRGYACRAQDADERKGWLGKLRTAPGERLKGWYTCDDVLPEQGLWLLYRDGEAVYLDRGEILEACGIDGEWALQSEHFEFGHEAALDMEMESDGEDIDSEDEGDNLATKRQKMGGT